MKARFVFESINFERGKSPISTMGIGVVGNLPELIFETDMKTGYGIIDDESDLDEKEAPGTIRSIVQNSSRILIQFYRASIRNMKTKKKITKIRYAEYLIKTAGLENLFKRIYYEHHSTHAVYFTLIDEYKGHFKHEEVFFPDMFDGTPIDESVNFERGEDPRHTMGIGVEGKIRETLQNEDLLEDLIYNISGALGSALDVYLPEIERKELSRMWLENMYGVKNWEFKSIVEFGEDEEDDESYADQIDHDIKYLERQGWILLFLEDNYGQAEAILYRPK